ncbi:hypothetical protein G5B39_13040 (plasmid) [Rhodobacteraceae bacterium SC52]|nr:hypothetical protein G5B39_13040 [Rhodobacteraceae bacterium SC52]
MKISEPLGPLCFLCILIAFFGVAVAATEILRARANVLNETTRVLPETQGLPGPLHYYPKQANAWLENTASASQAEVWVIGTSVSLRGFDPCATSGMANFSRSAADITAAARWAGKAATENPHIETIVLELSLSEPDMNLDADASRTINFVLALQKFLQGEEWVATPDDSGSCANPFSNRYFPFKPVSTPDLDRLRSRKSGFLDNARGLGDWCAAEGNRRIIFHLPPLNPVVYRRQPELEPVMKEVSDILSTLVQDFTALHPACNAVFRAPDADASTPEDWMDGLHFRPSFGTPYLESLLRQP